MLFLLLSTNIFLSLNFKGIAPKASARYSDAIIDYKLVVIASLSILLDASTYFVRTYTATRAVFLVVQWSVVSSREYIVKCL